MATYGQRDKFIQTLVTFTTSEQAKAMTAPERQDLLLKIRDKYAPELSNDDWGEIAQGVNNFKFVITDTVKYGEVPHIEDQLPIVEEQEQEQETEPEVIFDEEVDEAESPPIEDDVPQEDIPEDGVTEEDDYDIPKKEEPTPEPESKQFGKFVAPKEIKPGKINTTRLKGLLKPKKKD